MACQFDKRPYLQYLFTIYKGFIYPSIYWLLLLIVLLINNYIWKYLGMQPWKEDPFCWNDAAKFYTLYLRYSTAQINQPSVSFSVFKKTTLTSGDNK